MTLSCVDPAGEEQPTDNNPDSPGKKESPIKLQNFLKKEVMRYTDGELRTDTVDENGQIAAGPTTAPVKEIAVSKNCPKYDENFNPVEPVTNPDFGFSVVSSFGMKMMKQMGFKEGHGLGRNNQE